MIAPETSARNERRLFVASALTNVGDWLTYVAVASLAATGPSAARSLAFVVLGQTLPRAVLAPLAGRVVDRVERTRAYAGAEVARGAVVLVMAIMAYRGEVEALARAPRPARRPRRVLGYRITRGGPVRRRA